MSQRKLTPAQALLSGGHPEEALKYTDGDPYTRAVCLRHLGRFDEAVHALLEITVNKPDHFAAFNSLGMINTDIGDFEYALRCFEEAHRIASEKPLTPEALSQIRINLAYAYMRFAMFDEAWPLWESSRYGHAWQTPLVPWGGQPGRVLVVCEGGYGDQILFCRYLQLAKQKADITYYCFEKLIPIMPEYCKPMIAHDESQPLSNYYPGVDWSAYDYATSILSLPAIFGIETKIDELTEEIIPQIPPDPGGWPAEQVPERMRRGVGLCWAAEENGVQRRSRSMPVEAFEPLKALPFRSLCPDRDRPDWVEPCGVKSWMDTVRVLQMLDCVITIDTAVAHLVGAMKVPTYLLLPKGSDWKYFTESSVGNQSPWYPSVKLIRNTDPLDWTPAVELLMRELRADGRL